MLLDHCGKDENLAYFSARTKRYDPINSKDVGLKITSFYNLIMSIRTGKPVTSVIFQRRMNELLASECVVTSDTKGFIDKYIRCLIDYVTRSSMYSHSVDVSNGTIMTFLLSIAIKHRNLSFISNLINYFYRRSGIFILRIAYLLLSEPLSLDEEIIEAMLDGGATPSDILSLAVAQDNIDAVKYVGEKLGANVNCILTDGVINPDDFSNESLEFLNKTRTILSIVFIHGNSDIFNFLVSKKLIINDKYTKYRAENLVNNFLKFESYCSVELYYKRNFIDNLLGAGYKFRRYNQNSWNGSFVNRSITKFYNGIANDIYIKIAKIYPPSLIYQIVLTCIRIRNYQLACQFLDECLTKPNTKSNCALIKRLLRRFSVDYCDDYNLETQIRRWNNSVNNGLLDVFKRIVINGVKCIDLKYQSFISSISIIIILLQLKRTGIIETLPISEDWLNLINKRLLKTIKFRINRWQIHRLRIDENIFTRTWRKRAFIKKLNRLIIKSMMKYSRNILKIYFTFLRGVKTVEPEMFKKSMLKYRDEFLREYFNIDLLVKNIDLYMD